MMNLAVQFNQVCKYLLPLPIRYPRMEAWVGALLSPLQTLNAVFVAWAAGIRYDLGFTGQQANLEHLLNDLYDSTLRRIYLTDPSGVYVFTAAIFNANEAQPTSVVYNLSESGAANTAVLRNRAEVFVSGADFVIKIPSALNVSATTDRMKSTINKYKQAGKAYSFETI